MLNNQDFAQSRTKCLGQSTSGQVLVFPSNPKKINPKSNVYAQARNQLAETILKIDGAYAPATIRAYRSNFEFFINYCEQQNLNPLPCLPSTLANYISHLSNQKLKAASIRLASVAVAVLHRLNRYMDPSKDPDVVLELRKMHRKLGRSQKQAAAINFALLETMISVTDDSLRGYRDRALLLTAYDSLCRRGELTSLQVDDISPMRSGAGMKIRLRKSKSDQNANGRWISLGARTKMAIEDWLRESKITSGFLFRGVTKYDTASHKIEGGQINRIYKRLAKKANLDSQLIKQISGHSLRVGSAQDLLISGASFPILMTRGRWSKVDTVMRYVEKVEGKIE